MSGFFPDMPCMKRVYRDKKGVGPLVSSQERIGYVGDTRAWICYPEDWRERWVGYPGFEPNRSISKI